MSKISALLLLILSSLPAFPQRAALEERLVPDIQRPIQNVQELSRDTWDKSDKFIEISLGAKSAYFADYKNGFVFYDKNSSKKLPMASTTKLMTAIIVVEELNLEEKIEIKNLTNQPLDTLMGLSVGDKLKIKDILHGLLIESGADAARVLAIEAAGSEENFVTQMNETAQKFGLKDTQFTNSVGYDDVGHYSTAQDLYKLAKISLVNPVIKEIVQKKTYMATTESGKKIPMSNTNKLLANPYIKGVKTGTTLLGGECLIALYQDGKNEILGVVLDSPDRFSEANTVFGWTKQSFTW